MPCAIVDRYQAWCGLYRCMTKGLTVLEFRPIEAAFQAECVPEGSVWYSAGLASLSNPTTRVDMPKGRVPPLCVYFCWMLAIHRVR